MINKLNKKKFILKIIDIHNIPPQNGDNLISVIFRIIGFQCVNLIKYVSINRSDEYFVLIMNEYRNIYDINIQNIDIEERYNLNYYVCKSLEVLHQNGIINGNLKPSNIFINDENTYIISDYCQNVLFRNSPEIQIFTVYKCKYYSPEQLKSEEISYNTDVWSFGCIMYYSSYGKDPFDGKNLPELFRNISHNKLEFSQDKLYEDVNRFIQDMVKTEPSSRLSLYQIYNRINCIINVILDILKKEKRISVDNNKENLNIKPLPALPPHIKNEIPPPLPPKPRSNSCDPERTRTPPPLPPPPLPPRPFISTITHAFDSMDQEVKEEIDNKLTEYHDTKSTELNLSYGIFYIFSKY